MKDFLILGFLIGALLAAAQIGSAKAERAHRSIEQQYNRCLAELGTRAEFRTCLRRTK